MSCIWFRKLFFFLINLFHEILRVTFIKAQSIPTLLKELNNVKKKNLKKYSINSPAIKMCLRINNKIQMINVSVICCVYYWIIITMH